MTVALTCEQIRRVDKLAIERYGISGLVLMENAGRNAASLIGETYGDNGSAFIVCGVGNNGGDGFVIARHLHNAGWSVRLALAGDPSRMTSDTQTNHRITVAMAIPIVVASDAQTQRMIIDSIRKTDVVVDALLGTGFQGDVREPTATLIRELNDAGKRAMVAVDLPSGLDADSGQPSNATIQADLTVTFVARKCGFSAQSAARFLGRVEVADIGAPRQLIEEIVGSA